MGTMPRQIVLHGMSFPALDSITIGLFNGLWRPRLALTLLAFQLSVVLARTIHECRREAAETEACRGFSEGARRAE
jgi:hypothetical protein